MGAWSSPRHKRQAVGGGGALARVCQASGWVRVGLGGGWVKKMVSGLLKRLFLVLSGV